MAHLVMAVHDIGKLNTGWQTWAQQWQKAIGQGELTFPAAHTDYDPDNPAHQIKVGKRPPHAIESALAALPILQAPVMAELEQYKPLVRAAFTAVARHHAPFTSEPNSYQLIPTHLREIENTLKLLPDALQQIGQDVDLNAKTNVKTDLPPGFLDRYMFINPRNAQDVLCYMLLVRALRTADQTGTRLGSPA